MQLINDNSRPKGSKPSVRRVAILAIFAALFVSGTSFYTLLRFGSIAKGSLLASNISKNNKVTALGRLEPAQEVIHLSASTLVEGSRVAQLFVKQGDRVRSGQIIAILDSDGRLLATLEQAKQQLNLAQAKLAQVKVGAKIGEINAQKAVIARLKIEQQEDATAKAANVVRLEAEFHNAQTEHQRYQSLYQAGALSASSLDSKYLILETVQQQLNEAKADLNRIKRAKQQQLNEATATLNRIAEVRPVDVQVAQVEVNITQAGVKKAKADLDLAYVKASKDGQILKIHTWPGEVIATQGIADLGQTSQMYAIAEVYESDINKVRLGQRAIITSSAFNERLQGTVDEIGLQVFKKDTLDTDPVAEIDSRVVEIDIRLDPAASSQVAHLTNLQVKVEIEL